MDNKKKKRSAQNVRNNTSNNNYSWDQFFTGWDIGSDDGFPIIALLLLIVGILGGTIYFLWQAPVLLDTVFVEALILTGSLKKIKHEDDVSTIGNLISKTWVPFLIVLLLVLIFAFSANSYCHGVETFDMLLNCKS